MTPAEPFPNALLDDLACPRDCAPLALHGTNLACVHGHRYPIVQGVPVLLRDDAVSAYGSAPVSLAQSRGETAIPTETSDGPFAIDSFVQRAIGATNGIMYTSQIGGLRRYPIPELRLPRGDGTTRLVDVGCNWGRWSLAAARAGYRPLGIDSCLEAVLAARRVARQLGLAASFICGDARYLPLRAGRFDVAFSYSVLQHFEEQAARRALAEIHRVLVDGGRSFIQMPNLFGARCLYHRLRQGLRGPEAFDVRYRTPSTLIRTFTSHIGPSELSVDGFFSLNPQTTDLDVLPSSYRAVVRTSSALTRLSRYVPALRWVADSLYVTSTKRP